MKRPWITAELVALRQGARAGAPLAFTAGKIGRAPEECDRALWVLLGRSMDDALSLLSEAEVPPVASPPSVPAGERRTMREIASEVAAIHGLTFQSLQGQHVPLRVSHVRQEAFWEIRRQTSQSLPAIARFFGLQDHTSVHHGVRAHAARAQG